ncbi:MAG: PCRF domain-containing protein, partial [Syntrophomonadaceae bacterium]|nr:PCRF domain-containing protein [Syntrophomonadaceae bacterium]
MLEKLESLEEKYEELTGLLSQAEVISDQSKLQKFAKAHSDLSEIVDIYRQYKSVLKQSTDSKQMMQEEQDDDFRQMLVEEIQVLQEKKTSLEQNLKVLLLPKDPNDEKSV